MVPGMLVFNQPSRPNLMSDIIIEPAILPKEEELEGACLFCLTPYESGVLKRIIPSRLTSQLFLFHSNLYKISAESSDYHWAGPAIGAPMAVMTLEKLIALGLKRFIAVGWCGSLDDNVRATDLVIPSWGISEEGTSRHYLGGRIIRLPGFFREKVIDHLTAEDFIVHPGPVWTTDALYRESWPRAKHYSTQGIVAVDMEFTALARIASFRGIELSVVLIVSDEIRKGISKSSFKGKVFKRKSRTLLESLLGFLGGA